MASTLVFLAVMVVLGVVAWRAGRNDTFRRSVGTSLSALEEVVTPRAAEHRFIDEHAAGVDDDDNGDGGTLRVHIKMSSHNDVVAAVEGSGLPLRGPSGCIYLLHDDDTVTQHETTAQASVALVENTELLLWPTSGAAVAASLSTHDGVVVCDVDVRGASDEERRAAVAMIAVLEEQAG